MTADKFILLAVLFFVPFSLTAQLIQDKSAETSDSDAKLYKIRNMLDNKDFRTNDGIGRIHVLAEDIGNFQKNEFYEKYQTSGWWGLLNIYGIGSFIQGDPMTSVYTIAGELGGLLLAASGINISSSNDGRVTEVRTTPLFYVGYGIALGVQCE